MSVKEIRTGLQLGKLAEAEAPIRAAGGNLNGYTLVTDAGLLTLQQTTKRLNNNNTSCYQYRNLPCIVIPKFLQSSFLVQAYSKSCASPANSLS